MINFSRGGIAHECRKILETKGTDTVTIAITAQVSDAIGLLNDKNIGAVVVVDDKGRAAGILSERDIVRRLRSFAGESARASQFRFDYDAVSRSPARATIPSMT